MDCHHCPHCATCYPSFADYIAHFRDGSGRLRFTTCRDAGQDQ